MSENERTTLKIALIGGSEFDAQDADAISQLAQVILDVASYANVELFTGMASGVVYQLVLKCNELRTVAISQGTLEAGQLKVIGYSPWSSETEHRQKPDPQDLLKIVDKVHHLTPREGDWDAERFGANAARLVGEADAVVVMKGGPGTRDELSQAFAGGKPVAVYEAVSGTYEMFNEVKSGMDKSKSVVVMAENPYELLAHTLGPIIEIKQYQRLRHSVNRDVEAAGALL